MLVKHFRNRDILGNWYPIVSINFYDHAMTSMMVLRQGYAFIFVSSDVTKLGQVLEFP